MRLDMIFTMKDIQINSNLDALKNSETASKHLLKDIINGLSLTVIDYNHINRHECQRTEIKRNEKDCENHRQESEQES